MVNGTDDKGFYYPVVEETDTGKSPWLIKNMSMMKTTSCSI